MGLNVLQDFLKKTSKNNDKHSNVSAGYSRADLRKKKKIRKIIIWSVVVIAVVIALLVWSGLSGKSGKNGQSEDFTTFTVMRRDIENVLSGTGTLQPYDSYNVNALASGEILEDYFEEGDEVEEDALLMKIDSSSLETSLERAQKNYENAVEKLEDLLESKEDLKVTSDYTGTVQVMDFEVGDEIKAGAAIANIVDRETMLIDIYFLQAEAFNINKGDIATLFVGEQLEEISGVVEKISPTYEINSNGVKITEITISVKNPGAITENTFAMAKVGEYACAEQANFYYNVNETVVSESSGTVVHINKNKGEWINKGEILVTLENEDIDDSIEDARDSVEDALNSLEDAEDAFDNYEITAPISGTVIQKNYKKGEKIGSSSGGSTIAIIYDLSALKFDMNIDELDIDDLKMNQEVKITSDAKPGITYTGTITKISVQGTTSNGTTYYPITVTVNDYGQNTGNALRPGMNIDAEIILEKVENALVVPVGAIGRGNKVKVLRNADGNTQQSEKSDKEDFAGDMSRPEGMELPENIQIPSGERPRISGGYSTASKNSKYEEITVETGISDEDYIQIISGLNEGDVVIVENSAIGGNVFEKMMSMGGMSMSGGMPGGMSGGMPSGTRPGGMSGAMAGGR